MELEGNEVPDEFTGGNQRAEKPIFTPKFENRFNSANPLRSFKALHSGKEKGARSESMSERSSVQGKPVNVRTLGLHTSLQASAFCSSPERSKTSGPSTSSTQVCQVPGISP